ncbi:MAG: primosomal protein N', partial [Bdellovibrionales bacterium]|nr:primosomal protein N' [Bdellovibrionales bacterium]
MSEKLFSIAVDAPINSTLTYLAPEDGIELSRGDSVKVPLGKRSVDAVVLGETSERGEFALKNISEKNSEKPPLPEKFLKWLEWLAKYYVNPVGQVTKLAFPPLKKQTSLRKSKKSAVVPQLPLSQKLTLTHEQKICFEQIAKSQNFAVHLLHGVTGSGKTEIYLQLIESVLAQ